MTKGKLAKRSWAELPHEAILLVAETIVSKEPTSYPPSWSTNARHSGHRRVWAVLMQAQILSNLQNVCREWEAALNFAPFWWYAIEILDPHRDHEVHNRTSGRDALSQCDIFRHIYNSSCMPCRINSFYDSSGIGASARMEETPVASVIGCCAVHASHTFCFMCFQDAVPHSRLAASVSPISVDRYGRWSNTGLQRNWDYVGFHRHAKYLCYSCRYEHLCSTIVRELGGRESLQRALDIVPCHKVIRDFAAVGVGDIASIITTISEQFWLTDNGDDYEQTIQTKYQAERVKRARHGHITPEDEAESVRVATGPKYLTILRNYTLSSWAQQRVMEGLWIAPYDTLHESFRAVDRRLRDAQPLGMFVTHPFGELIPEYGSDYPVQSAVIAPLRSEQLWEDLSAAFESQFKRIVGPALKNCLARLTAAAEAQGLDICRWVWNVEPSELLGSEFLLAPEIWCPCYDWTQRYRHSSNAPASETSDDGSPTLTHSPSDATSSTDERPSPSTTLQTTPSPSPDLKAKSLDMQTDSSAYTVKTASQIVADLAASEPTSPTDESQMVPFDRVPHIPCSHDLIGKSVQTLIRDMWRDIVAPIFDCSCSICARAAVIAKEHEQTAKENVASGNDLIHHLIDSGEWSAYNGRKSRSPAVLYFSEEEDYFDDDEEDDDEDEDEFDDELEEFEYEGTITTDGNGRKTYHSTYVVGSNYPIASNTINHRLASSIPSAYIPTQTTPTAIPSTMLDPRLAKTSLPVRLSREQLAQVNGSVLAPSFAPAPVAANPGHYNLTYARGRTPGPPSMSLTKRRSRSPSASTSDSEDRRKRQRSSSLERVAGERRLRDDGDVGGPDGEIVYAEDEHGHGRKRVKSSDGDEAEEREEPLRDGNADEDTRSEDSSAAFELRPVLESSAAG